MKPRIFRIDDDKRSPSRKGNGEDALQTVAKQVGKNNQFLYIDISSESGYRMMKECQSSDEDEEVDKIGRKYRVNLNGMQTPNSKALSFLNKMKDFTHKKEKAMSMVKNELNKSTQKHFGGQAQPANSTRYLRRERELSSNQSKKSPKLKNKYDDTDFFELINRSLTGDILQIKNFETLPVRKYSQRSSPANKTEKYMERMRLILPGIKSVRKSVVA